MSLVSYFSEWVRLLSASAFGMGRAKYTCEYCDKTFEDSQDARKRHANGRNHKANVKLWYDSFSGAYSKRLHARTPMAVTSLTCHALRADQARRQATAASPAPLPLEWQLVAPSNAVPMSTRTLMQGLPPSMIPPPPEVFLYCRTDWG